MSAASRRTETLQRRSPFFNHLSHQIEHATDQRLCRRITGQMIGGDVKLHRGAQETLQQRIVQVLRDACALGKPLFKPQVQLFSQPMQAQAVKDEYGKRDGHQSGEAEPPGLPEYRLNLDLDG